MNCTVLTVEREAEGYIVHNSRTDEYLHFDIILLTSINWDFIFLPPIPLQGLYIHDVINRGTPRREGLLGCSPPPPPSPKNQNLKNIEFVEMMISDNLRDLSFS
jgi:hypothetical protein